jgi:hypothetical protein
MITSLGHAGTHRRDAINVGSGVISGLNSVLMGAVYELNDYKTPSADVVAHLQAIIDEAFGRTSAV